MNNTQSSQNTQSNQTADQLLRRVIYLFNTDLSKTEQNVVFHTLCINKEKYTTQEGRMNIGAIMPLIRELSADEFNRLLEYLTYWSRTGRGQLINYDDAAQAETALSEQAETSFHSIHNYLVYVSSTLDTKSRKYTMLNIACNEAADIGSYVHKAFEE